MISNKVTQKEMCYSVPSTDSWTRSTSAGQ